MALLAVEDLRVSFHTRRGVLRAVDGVSLSLEQGTVLGLVGESGCGKSVTALSIIGLLPSPPARIGSGQIAFEGCDLTALDQRALEDVRGRKIAMVFQDPMAALNPTQAVGTQLVETLRRHLDLSREQARRRAVGVLEEVRLPRAHERLRDYPHELSGGMRQRVMIALAIACEPKLLIADEPTTSLDVTIQAQILDLLDELCRARGMAMILITHDIGVLAEATDEVAVMYAGQIVERCETLTLFEHPEHPYTEALLRAHPRLESQQLRDGRLPTIPGRPPDPAALPTACRFAPRCAYAGADLCTKRSPPLREIRPGHLVRTYHPASERLLPAERA